MTITTIMTLVMIAVMMFEYVNKSRIIRTRAYCTVRACEKLFSFLFEFVPVMYILCGLFRGNVRMYIAFLASERTCLQS